MSRGAPPTSQILSDFERDYTVGIIPSCLQPSTKMETTSNDDQNYVDAVLSSKIVAEGGTFTSETGLIAPTIHGSKKRRPSTSPKVDSETVNKPSEKRTCGFTQQIHSSTAPMISSKDTKLSEDVDLPKLTTDTDPVDRSTASKQAHRRSHIRKKVELNLN